MNILLQRLWFIKSITKGKTCTIGKLYLDGVFECYTLEDEVRADGVKVPSLTAIPYGEYQVVMDFSERFQTTMPHILNVPGFEGIRIHCGNTALDTEGCILLGTTKGKEDIGNSRDAFHNFLPKLDAATKKGEAWINIVKG